MVCIIDIGFVDIRFVYIYDLWRYWFCVYVDGIIDIYMEDLCGYR